MATLSNADTFRLRSLPLELCNKIYQYVVGKEFIVMWGGYRTESYNGDCT